jgi:hypothetical protein
MSLEFWSAAASVATFVVLAITAIVAVVQLRHIRGSNQVAALDEFREALDSPQYRAGVLLSVELLRRIDEPAVRRDLEADLLPEWLQPVVYLFRLFETFGTYVKHGILDEGIVFDLWSSVFIDNWNRLAPAIVVMRRTDGPAFLENFEMLACIAMQWKQRSATRYPKHLLRIAPEDRWLAEDRAAEQFTQR